MVPAGHLLAFALISFALIIVPGPNVLFIISRSLMLGRTAGVGTALGGQVAGTARTWLARSPRRLEVIGGTSGLVMIGIGATLALNRRSD